MRLEQFNLLSVKLDKDGNALFIGTSPKVYRMARALLIVGVMFSTPQNRTSTVEITSQACFPLKIQIFHERQQVGCLRAAERRLSLLCDMQQQP